MTDWTSGYVADIGYTYGYYEELNPLRARLALINSGIACPQIMNACELGFGQGVSVNFHAASSSTSWFGTDFNPSQAAFAQELASVTQSGAKLYDQAFEDFCHRTDLPDLDYIGLHGIWSWISDANRAVIVDFIARKLRVGGILYISYNTLPGWSSAAPTRQLMSQYANVMGSAGSGTIRKVEEALEFVGRVFGAEPKYLTANPTAGPRFEQLKTQNRHYLAHEYFNRDWRPMYFSEMAQWLEPAKLSFACSANYHEQIDVICLKEAQQKLISEIPDPNLRQLVRDYCLNQQFRKDYWVKGPRKLSGFDQVETLRSERILGLKKPADVSLKITAPIGECTLNEEIYGSMLELIGDHQIRSIGEIENKLRGKNINLSSIMQSIMVLSGSGHIAAAQDEASISKAKKQVAKLNQHLIKLARTNNDVAYLASPVTGGGINIGRFEQLFLLGLSEGKKQPSEWAAHAWNILSLQGQRLIKEGKQLETAEENLAELTSQAKEFAEKRLPVAKALGLF